MSYAEISPAVKLNAAYENLLGRKLGSAGRDYWLSDDGKTFRSSSGMTPHNVNSFLTGSDEYRLNQAYKANLGRDVGDEGRAYWLKDGKFTSGATADNINSMLIAGVGNDADKKAAAKTLIEAGTTPAKLPVHLKEYAPISDDDDFAKTLPYEPDKYLDVKSDKMDKVDDTAITDINAGAKKIPIGDAEAIIGEKYANKLTASDTLRGDWEKDKDFGKKFGSWAKDSGPSTEAEWEAKRDALDTDTAKRRAAAETFGDDTGLTADKYKAATDVEDALAEDVRVSTDLKLGDYATTDALRKAELLKATPDKKDTTADLGIADVARDDVFDISKYTKPTDDVTDDITGVDKPDPFSLAGVTDDITGVSGADIKDDVKIDTTTPIVNPLSSKWRTAHSLRGQSAMGIRSAQSQRARKGTLGAGTKALSRDMQINTLNV